MSNSTEFYSDTQIRQVVRHSARRHLLTGKCQTVVRYTYDGNKLYAIYDSGDGQQAAYEVQVGLLSVGLSEALK